MQTILEIGSKKFVFENVASAAKVLEVLTQATCVEPIDSYEEMYKGLYKEDEAELSLKVKPVEIACEAVIIEAEEEAKKRHDAYMIKRAAEIKTKNQ